MCYTLDLVQKMSQLKQLIKNEVSFVLGAFPLISASIFLTSIWLPHGQLWAIIEMVASIT